MNFFCAEFALVWISAIIFVLLAHRINVNLGVYYIISVRGKQSFAVVYHTGLCFVRCNFFGIPGLSSDNKLDGIDIYWVMKQRRNRLLQSNFHLYDGYNHNNQTTIFKFCFNEAGVSHSLLRLPFPEICCERAVFFPLDLTVSRSTNWQLVPSDQQYHSRYRLLWHYG